MGWLFEDPLYEQFASRSLCHALYGGADFGECLVTASQITPGDAESWWRGWIATGDRVFQVGQESAAKGHDVSAREAFLRASNYYRTSYLPLYVTPLDERMKQGFARESEAFRLAAERMRPIGEFVEIPYDGTTLPAYFYRADESGSRGPLLITTNGFDSTIHEMYFAHAIAANRRGYHCLTFDGPGQGRPLIQQGLAMRPDWEHVVRQVVDYALTRPEVDSKRIALLGWSFGGYLAPRAASGEPRLAACLADPGQWDQLEAIRLALPLTDDARQRLPDITAAELKMMEDQIWTIPRLRWTFGRILLVLGLKSMGDLLRVAGDYTLKGRAEKIQCPTLLTWGETDPIARFAEHLFDALTCPKMLVRFTRAEGAGGHCEETARASFHQRTFDWLDEIMQKR